MLEALPKMSKKERAHLDLVTWDAPLDFVGFTWKTETPTWHLLFQVTCPEDPCMAYLPTFTINR